MKIVKIITAALIFATGMMSCKKDHENKPNTVTIEGHWEGTYVNDASGNTFYYSFNIKSGGVIEEINSSGQKIGEGTWTLDNNNILTAHYNWLPPSNSSYSVIAAFYPNTSKLLGDWGYGANATNGGTFEMTKKSN